MGDPTRLRQILNNLLSNACKFTENGEISLDIQPRLADDKWWIVWSVRDTGIGISPEGRDKLFKTFSQVDGSATRKHGGSGLGLAISQQLCHAMGAHITVQSTVGVETIFTIHVPATVREPELFIRDRHFSDTAPSTDLPAGMEETPRTEQLQFPAHA